MATRIAERWFERRRIDDDITLLWEPHVDPLIRCNIWHVRGRDRDMLIDTGLGISSLRDAARDIFDKRLTAVATHTHFDHIGGIFEFEERVVHESEAAIMADGSSPMMLRRCDFSAAELRELSDVGYPVERDELISAVPDTSFDIAAHRTQPAPCTWAVKEGDRLDLGNRSFEVLHLPGHSPGSIGLWEEATGTLFSGDAVYDGALLTNFPGSSLDDYVCTMLRLRELPVRVVHGGHEPSFGCERLREIADEYLHSWERAGAVVPGDGATAGRR
jgi:glyoxylase-like metal-dependent hydrolase (beta-lactamase superfamily II)